MSVAEDMTEGVVCMRCGIYFEEEYGYPAMCKSCWKDPQIRGPISVCGEWEDGKHYMTSDGVQKAHIPEAKP